MCVCVYYVRLEAMFLYFKSDDLSASFHTTVYMIFDLSQVKTLASYLHE